MDFLQHERKREEGIKALTRNVHCDMILKMQR